MRSQNKYFVGEMSEKLKVNESSAAKKFSSCRSVTSRVFTKGNFSMSGEKIAEKIGERAEKLVKL